MIGAARQLGVRQDVASASCAPSQTLAWSSVSDTFSCIEIAGLNASVITDGTIDGARLPASATAWRDGGAGIIYYNSGNVGIGTSSPVTTLDVNGGLRLGSSTVVTATCDNSIEGTIRYNYTSHLAEYCDGTLWRALTAIAGQTLPNPFSFTDQTGVNTNTTVTSNAVTLSGFTGSLTATCANCTAIARNGVWSGTTVVGFQANDTIAIRQTSSASMGTGSTATVTVGGTTSGTWTVTTTNSTPNPFSFVDQSGITSQRSISSNEVTLAGFTGTLTASCMGCTSIARDGVWMGTTVGGFTAGSRIAIRMLSPTVTGTSKTATVTVGSTTSGTWTVSSVNTCAPGIAIGDVCPDGTIYAGISPDTSAPMYTTRCDANQYWDGNACVACATGFWTGTGTTCVTTYTNTVVGVNGDYGNGPGLTFNKGVQVLVFSGVSNQYTGKGNTEALVGQSDGAHPYDAPNYCDQLNANGREDWYLPATQELVVLAQNNLAIGNFSPTNYWGSQDRNIEHAYVVNIVDGSIPQYGDVKFSSNRVRCVRR